jgi:hypothetical protein
VYIYSDCPSCKAIKSTKLRDLQTGGVQITKEEKKVKVDTIAKFKKLWKARRASVKEVLEQISDNKGVKITSLMVITCNTC